MELSKVYNIYDQMRKMLLIIIMTFFLMVYKKVTFLFSLNLAAVHGVFYSVGFIIYSILAYFIPPWRRQIQVLAVMQIPTLLSVL